MRSEIKDRPCCAQNGLLLSDSSYVYIATRLEAALQTAGCIEESIGNIYLAREYKYECRGMKKESAPDEKQTPPFPS